MSVLTAFIIMGLVLLGIVLLCFGAVWLEKNVTTERYDERQRLARGRGYRLSFFVGILFMLVTMAFMVYQVDGEKTVEPFLLVYFCIIIQAMVFHVYCLINHAALPFSEKPVVPLICYTFIGVMDLFSFRNAVAIYPLALVGHGTTGWISLVQMFFWLGLAFMYLIQLLRREKE